MIKFGSIHVGKRCRGCGTLRPWSAAAPTTVWDTATDDYKQQGQKKQVDYYNFCSSHANRVHRCLTKCGMIISALFPGCGKPLTNMLWGTFLARNSTRRVGARPDAPRQQFSASESGHGRRMRHADGFSAKRRLFSGTFSIERRWNITTSH